MELLVAAAGAVALWLYYKKRKEQSSQTSETPPEEEPPAEQPPPAKFTGPITLKVKLFTGQYEIPIFRVSGQATLNVGQSKRAFCKYWQTNFLPPIWYIATVNLKRTSADRIEGQVYLNGISAWKGVLMEDGKPKRKSWETEVAGIKGAVVTIAAWL